MVDFNLAGYETADPGMTGAPAGERIDILRGKTSLSLDNKMEKLEGALKPPLRSITHVGYVIDSAMVDVAPIAIE